MMLFPIVIIGLIVWGIIELNRRGSFRMGNGEKRSPLDIAKERYANGEITKEQYEQLKRDLS